MIPKNIQKLLSSRNADDMKLGLTLMFQISEIRELFDKNHSYGTCILTYSTGNSKPYIIFYFVYKNIRFGLDGINIFKSYYPQEITDFKIDI